MKERDCLAVETKRDACQPRDELIVERGGGSVVGDSGVVPCFWPTYLAQLSICSLSQHLGAPGEPSAALTIEKDVLREAVNLAISGYEEYGVYGDGVVVMVCL